MAGLIYSARPSPVLARPTLLSIMAPYPSHAPLARRYHSRPMSRQVASDDADVRRQWPVLFWANRVALACAAAGFLIWIVSAGWIATHPPVEAIGSSVRLIPGFAFLTGAVFALAFILTGYVRLLKVHRTPGRVIAPSQRLPARRLTGVLIGAIVLGTGVAAGLLHFDVRTVVVVLIVVAGLLLAERWR